METVDVLLRVRLERRVSIWQLPEYKCASSWRVGCLESLLVSQEQ